MKWNILILWPSWAWKTTINNEIISHNRNYSIFTPDTSRGIREWEKDGVDYNFIKKDIILERSKYTDKYLTEEYFGNYYGYDLWKFSTKENEILTIWIKLAEDVLKRKEEFWIKISILLSIDCKTFRDRLEKRWENFEEINKRLRSLELLDFYNKVDIVIDWNSSIECIKKQILWILI